MQNRQTLNNAINWFIYQALPSKAPSDECFILSILYSAVVCWAGGFDHEAYCLKHHGMRDERRAELINNVLDSKQGVKMGNIHVAVDAIQPID